MARITKLLRYPHKNPRVCPYCLMNPSLGMTSYGTLGCKFCQAEVDLYIEEHFEVMVEEV